MKSEIISRIRQYVKNFLRAHGYVICRLPESQAFSELIADRDQYQIPGDFHRYYRPWEAPEFRRSLAPEAIASTMLPMLKIYFLLCLLKQTRWLEGAVLEAGVWNGGSARIIADHLDLAGGHKDLWLLDTFKGYDAIDGQRDGVLAKQGLMRGKSIDEVKALFARTRTRVHFVEGSIPQSLRDVNSAEISFAHIDVNLYEPTRHATEFCLERMPRGGIIIFDDYNWPATYGARQAIDEACARFGQEAVSVPESSQAFLIRN